MRLQNAEPKHAIDVSQSATLRHVGSTVTNQLYVAAADGRVTDPADELFEPWSTTQQRILWPTYEWAYIYSYHQLLGLRRARGILAALKPRLEADHSISWHLGRKDLPDKATRANSATWRGLAVVLTALDTTYWPGIVQSVSFSIDEWREHRQSFDASETLNWLGVSVDDVAAAADQLRFSANFDDVLGDLYDIVRRVNPATWWTMRGSALTAMEDRVAAQVLHQAAEDVIGSPPPPPLPPPLSQQWLGMRPDSLDAALTSMRISPHPALVVAVEGETELEVLPKVFDLLGIRLEPTFIRIECFGGTGKDLSLMARFAAAPLLGRDHGTSVVMDRPVTRFLVLTDAENKYKTAADRRKQRILLLNSITKGPPPS